MDEDEKRVMLDSQFLGLIDEARGLSDSEFADFLRWAGEELDAEVDGLEEGKD